VVLSEPPFQSLSEGKDWSHRGRWPAKWVALAEPMGEQFVSAYRLSVALPQAKKVRIHVSADERYELFLDGKLVGRGPARGHIGRWPFETYDLSLEAGEHVLAARVWSLGGLAPQAQLSLRPGFLVAADDLADQATWNTGSAKWVGKVLPGYAFHEPGSAWGTGGKLTVDGRLVDWDWPTTSEEGWGPVAEHEGAVAPVGANDIAPTRLLSFSTLPAMLDAPFRPGTARHVAAHAGDTTAATPIRAADSLLMEQGAWCDLLRGRALTIPAQTSRRILIDLEDYVCGYPDLTLTGGKDASVRIHWQEALFEKYGESAKGNRDEIEGKFFANMWSWQDGVGDTFIADGGRERRFTTLWWEAGRYVEILVHTSAEPLTIESLGFRESRYPIEIQSKFTASDPRLAEVIPIAFRTLQMCSHETYMDCPFYEQLQYVGDTRLEVLTTYVTSHDDRLPRQALSAFNESRLVRGLTQSRFPSRVWQIIPPFSLWWIAMLHDFALWRGDMEFVKSLMPGVRTVLDAYRASVNGEGLLVAPDGWNYMDWVPGWGSGEPPLSKDGKSGVLNLQLALIARQASELETMVGEPELAKYHAKLSHTIFMAAERTFYDQRRGMFADDVEKTKFSEHAQCLALLEGSTKHRGSIADGLMTAPDLARTTIYFTHYLFETYRMLGKMDALMGRMSLWFDLKKNGLKTTIEHPEPTRSDCHAWGAHPIYHNFATILGVRPTSVGFKTVSVTPQLGPLEWASGTFPVPQGEISVEIRGKGGVVTLPPGIKGHAGTTRLREGKNEFRIV
jgi:hypothetical protein